MSNDAYKVLGKDTQRHDGIAKVTGREKYASDLVLPNMLHARILKSPYPHAKVKSIDVSGVTGEAVTTLVPDEVPDVLFCPRLVSIPSSTYKDWRVLTDNPRFVGEPIAAVAAESEEEAQAALEQIKVEYEEFPSVFDALESMKDGAVPIHTDIKLADDQLKIKNNIACSLDIEEGGVETGFAHCDHIIEHTYWTNRR